MKVSEIRQTFFDFFSSKGHEIVSSAPMVVKDDPTLMFINAGMNQFKDFFLGNRIPKNRRIANSQKCLRVSGKHNDLEEVGVDTYHHTMFEMLGNWSFGDYFKEEAIAWSWELLTEVYKLDKSRIYVTVFEGDKNDGISVDQESIDIWKKYIAEDRIILASKKDNFWEMGEIGPCGPCSEIHIDLRSDEDRKSIDGRSLVNEDHPQVIEIWNNVFMEFNRRANGDLEPLPEKHVDTGMGLERLAMAMQAKQSNYDTDLFQTLIQYIEKVSNKKYGETEETDIALRVIADHIRAIAFSIADGQLPSNTGAGYVIRRILRRAIRYGYQHLDLKDPFLGELSVILAQEMGESFPELIEQKSLIEKVIHEEEVSFFRTIANGLKRILVILDECVTSGSKKINGKVVFELYDTFGFPSDLTSLIAREFELEIDEEGFKEELEKQKNRSRSATAVSAEDWTELLQDEREEFVGYDVLTANVKIVKYRRVSQKQKQFYQVVFNLTPFYPEGGGQVGDSGYIEFGEVKTTIFDTKKENNLIIHLMKELPTNPSANFKAIVNKDKRIGATNNHTATHLLHYALRKVLGEHVGQKGSFVSADHLRFDFSHFEKISDQQLHEVEMIVFNEIRNNNPLEEKRNSPIEVATKMGAMALFGEKYGDTVRVIKFGESVELCGGTHVQSTGEIGLFIIKSEVAVAAGIRRIEAITSSKAEEYYKEKVNVLSDLSKSLKHPKDIVKAVNDLLSKNNALSKEIESFKKDKAKNIKTNLKAQISKKEDITLLSTIIELDSSSIKDILFQLEGENENFVGIIGGKDGDKCSLSVIFSKNLVSDKDYHAGNIIREVSSLIKGGGGGQPFFATAGGKNPDGLQAAIDAVHAKL